jgi:hypothetical protein
MTGITQYAMIATIAAALLGAYYYDREGPIKLDK